MSSYCLNTLLQAQHKKLSPAICRAPWQGQPNEFVFDLSIQQLGDLGEHLVAHLLGGVVEQSNRPAYDVHLKSRDWKIEVKTAREHFGGKNRKWNWSQLRKDDQHTHVCLVAISPNRVRIALLTRVQSLVLPGRYKQGKTGEYEQLKLTEAMFAQAHQHFCIG